MNKNKNAQQREVSHTNYNQNEKKLNKNISVIVQNIF